MNVENSGLVSIIIPAYNAEKYIGECIDSVLNQSYSNIQLLVIDDGSVDKTSEISNGFSSKDHRITVIRKANGGVSSARNLGIKEAKGDYICFVDADDILPLDSLESLVNALHASDADAVFGNCSYLFDGGSSFERVPKFQENNYNTSELLLIDAGTLSGITFGSVWGAIYKTAIIRDHKIFFRENLKINEDGVFNVEYCLKVSTIRYITKSIYHYRQWKTNKAPNMELMHKRMQDSTIALREICENRPLKNQSVIKELDARELFCIFQLSVTASSLKRKEAVTCYRSIWNHPLIKRSGEILNLDQIGKTKKILWNCITKKNYGMFYIAVHYLYPLLDKYIKR